MPDLMGALSLGAFSAAALALAACVLLLATALLGLRHFRRQARQLARLSDYRLLLAHIHRVIADADDETAFLGSVCALTVQHARVALTWVGRPDADGVFRYLASAGAQRGYLDGIEISVDPQRPEGRGTSGRTWREGRAHFNTVFGRTAFLEPWAARAARFGLRTSAAVPVRLENRTWAVFTLYSDEMYSFDPTLMTLINDLADSISAGLARIRLLRDQRAAHSLTAALLENLDAGIQVMRYPERGVERANARMLEMLGVRHAQDLHATGAHAVYDEATRERVDALTQEVLQRGSARLQDLRLLQAGGGALWIDISGSRIDLGDGVSRIVWTHVDVTRRRAQEQQLRRLGEMREALLDNTVVGINLVQYPERKVIDVNAALVHIMGYDRREDLLGLNPAQTYVNPDMARRVAELAGRILRDGSAELGDVQVVRRDGSVARLDMHGKRLQGEDPAHPVIVWTSVDATRKYELEAELQRQAHYDELTGLPNRRALRRRLRGSILRAQTRGGALAIGVLDLDDFKTVNDRFGHGVGDQLLRDIVQRLQAALHPGDLLARIGGDEFVLLLDDLPRLPEQAQLQARLSPLHEALQHDLPIPGQAGARIGMTMGLALFPDDADEADALLREADAAMYLAKARKATRTSWWRRAGDPLPPDDEDAEIDAFGAQAVRLLQRVGDAFAAVTRQYLADFDQRMREQPGAREILDCLPASDHERLKELLGAHLLHVLSPTALESDCERRALHVGQTHALIGLSASGVSRTVNEYRSLLRNRVQALHLPRRERVRLMQVTNARMQLELQNELLRMQEVYDAYNRHLAAALPAPTTTWSSAVRSELDALCGLPGIRAGLVMRLSPQGRFFAEFSAGEAAPTLDRILQDAASQPSLDSRQACGRGLVAHAWRSAEIQHSEAALLDPRLEAWHAALRDAGIQSVATLPVKDARNGFVLALYGMYPRQFSSGWAQTFVTSLRARWEHVAQASRSAFMPLLWQEAAEYRRLLHSGGLLMYGQPVLDTHAGHARKVEVLARLRGADGALIPPARFLHAFDDADVHTLFRLGMEQALRAQRAWRERGIALEVSLNIAPATLLHGEIVQWVRDALHEHGSEPASLTLEVLESQEFLDEHQARAVHRLSGLGVRLAIDDLGAGYSSLQRLVNLPFDVIKVDQALLRELAADPAKVLGLVNAIIRIGEDLGRSVVVEGVEDAPALEAMMILGARQVQGYAVARPMPLADIPAWTRDYSCPHGADGALHSLLGAFAWHWVHLRREVPGGPAVAATHLDVLRDYVRRHHPHDAELLETVQRHSGGGRHLLELLQRRLLDADRPRAA